MVEASAEYQEEVFAWASYVLRQTQIFNATQGGVLAEDCRAAWPAREVATLAFLSICSLIS